MEPPDISRWIDAVAGTAKYWVPILLAVFVAVEEVERRRRRDAR